MPATADAAAPRGYFADLATLIVASLTQLVRAPSHSRRAEAARNWARRSVLLIAILSAAIIILIYALDAFEIGLMPPRGTAALWPLRIATDFGKAGYVLSALIVVLIACLLVLPRLHGTSRAILVSFATRMQFVFIAVLLTICLTELIKGVVGRGRPFVGGAANPFNFSAFAWSEAYASFPSSHAATAFALGFAVAALWPSLRLAMLCYALLIAATRLVLLAHHPSDVTAGALVGVIGVMAVRYWFAARHLAFTIRRDGAIVPLPGPSFGHLKRVAGQAFAP